LGSCRQTNIDLGLAGNARIVANAADPFDTPEQIVIRERSNCVNSLAHWQIITESESIKEPRGRSRSQSYSQIALLHSHLFLHDQLTFADISGTDTLPRWFGWEAGLFLLAPQTSEDVQHSGHERIWARVRPERYGFKRWNIGLERPEDHPPCRQFLR
jgi:hypothetical protein